MEAEKWGRRIRAFRKLKGYTQEGFAKELGVSVSVLGEVERGNRSPSQDFVVEVAKTLERFNRRIDAKVTVKEGVSRVLKIANIEMKNPSCTSTNGGSL